MAFGDFGGTIGGGIGGLIGNHYNNPGDVYAKGMQPGIDRVQQGIDTATGYVSPWRTAGMSGLNDYMDMLKQYKNPTDMYNNIMGGWKMSQGAQSQMGGAMDAIKNQMASRGMMGSGQEMKDLGHNYEDYASRDQQQYLNNILGIGNTGLQGFNNLSQQGLGAAGTMGGYEMQGAGDIASMYGAIAAAKGNAASDANKSGANLLGGAMSWL